MVEKQTPTIQNMPEAQAWQERHEPTAPKVGDFAPNFTLADVNGEDTVTLSALRDTKPVALVFGSFT